MQEENPWKVLSSEIKYQNPWMRIREDKVITPTGNEGIYGLMESKDSMMVVVLNNTHEVYLVKTFRYPSATWNWELPGGQSDGQELVLASKRELEEETGIIAKTWEKLAETAVCNGFMTEKMATYLATDISFTGVKEDADEQIREARFFTVDEVLSMVDRGEINDGQSLTGLFLLQRWLAKQ